MKDILEKVKFDENGLVPAILQDIDSKEVLMLGYMNEESLLKTMETGKACVWSRSRQELWLKGETSGNYQFVIEIRFDCDNDSLLVKVKAAGPACHTGKKSCFYQRLSSGIIEEVPESCSSGNVSGAELDKAAFLYRLYDVIKDRKENPVEGSYTNYLFREGVDKICKKIGEEAAEVIIGAKNASKDEMIYEIGDLIYHLMVLLNLYNIPLRDIFAELESRSK